MISHPFLLKLTFPIDFPSQNNQENTKGARKFRAIIVVAVLGALSGIILVGYYLYKKMMKGIFASTLALFICGNVRLNFAVIAIEVNFICPFGSLKAAKLPKLAISFTENREK